MVQKKMVDATFYEQIVGRLRYLALTRPNIMHTISLISRYMENSTEVHLLVVRKIYCYIKGIVDFGILYKNGGNSNNDYAGDIGDRKSTS